MCFNIILFFSLGSAEANAFEIGFFEPSSDRSIDLKQGHFSTALLVSGLGNGPDSLSLGAYDLNISFNPDILTFSSVAFNGALDEGIFGSFYDSSVTSGLLNLFEVSFEDATLLNAQQRDGFLIATLDFDLLASGTSLLDIALNGPNGLLDANANPLQPEQFINNPLQLTVVSEPAGMLMFSLAGLLSLRRRAMLKAIKRVIYRSGLGLTKLGALLLAFSLPSLAQAGASSTSEFHEVPDFIPSIIVRLQAGAPLDSATIAAFSQASGTTLSSVQPISGGAYVVGVPDSMTASDIGALVTTLSADPIVDYVEANSLMVPLSVPNDEFYNEQWHYFEAEAGANLPPAWDHGQGSPTVAVAVLDTGIVAHQDINPLSVLPGFDFISDINLPGGGTLSNDGDGRDSNPSDPGDWREPHACGLLPFVFKKSSWHGTHVAGTIGAATDNNSGVSGLNWVSQILPVRVLGTCGGTLSDIADGLRWAAGLPLLDAKGQALKDANGLDIPVNPYPAQVINMSLGGEGSCSRTYQDAIDEVLASGSVIVVAAANKNKDVAGYRPANCNGVITVSATDRNGNKAPYSNYGSKVDISGPGGDISLLAEDGILSTMNTGLRSPEASPGGDSYAYYQGTSMAAPHVSGIVALMQSINPQLTSSSVLDMLVNSARPFLAGSDCNTATCGAGMVDASAAIDSVLKNRIPNNLIGDAGIKAGDLADKAPQSQNVQTIVSTISSSPGQNPEADLDEAGADRPIGLTHFFSLPQNALMTSAKLTLRFQGNSNLVHNDSIIYDQSVPVNDSVGFLPMISLRDLLGREPAVNEIHEVTLNLAKAPVRTVDTVGRPGGHWSAHPEEYRSLLGELVDGQFDLVIADDVTVDFSELRITFVSENDPSGDLNGDAVINRADIDILLLARDTEAYGPSDPRDLDANGVIDGRDIRLLIICQRTGQCSF